MKEKESDSSPDKTTKVSKFNSNKQSPKGSRPTLHHKSGHVNGQFEINESIFAEPLYWFRTKILALKHYWDKSTYLFSMSSLADDTAPLRAEIFSAEKMEQHGKVLASEHSLSRFGLRDHLLNRLDENKDVLIDSCNLLTELVKAKSRIVPAGEWLLDNFYLIEEQIRIARKHLPRGYSQELPRLAQGNSRGLPRVYDIALEVISHGDGRVDTEILSRFVAAYQTVTPLLLGELWAIPIMLRLALIENLRRVAARVTAAQIDANQAQEWANAMIDMAEKEPKNLIIVIADMARSNPPMVSAFVAELSRRLQGHGSALALPLNWIGERLAESSLTIEQMILVENQQQATDQVTISNTIGSLRSLDASDWRVFVESMSVVESILRNDINNVYSKMNFATRDRYRQVIDRLAKRIRLTESDVARKALSLAATNINGSDLDNHSNATTESITKANSPKNSNSLKNSNAHKIHVGYYLVDDGLQELEQTIRARVSMSTRFRRQAARYPLALYLSSILFFTILFSSVIIAQAQFANLAGWRLVLLSIFSVLAASQLAAALTNWFAVLQVEPTLLPRMNFEHGLPAELRTLVVIPTMLSSSKSIEVLLEALEVRFLGNQDEHLHFALLTDFSDADTEHLVDDDTLLQQTKTGIEALNQKYDRGANDRFYLFHRARRWNPAEGCWMGYERKRGKLADLNAVLTGEPQVTERVNGQEVVRDRFAVIVGNINVLTGRECLFPVKYIITLDTDTELPRDAARECVAAMAHPLNRPRYNEERTRVIAGYGILQPRMAASLVGATRSRYAQVNGTEPGIDPYTRSVSDVYQDVFGEGSFIGKGIYEIDAFETTLKGRFPHDRILSHDLLEGCYARSGLISDVQLYEEYPARYAADVSRRERWIRGDWQIASWVLPRVPSATGKRVRNPLSPLSRWKIADNLLRSLVPMAMLLMLLIGWIATTNPLTWTLTVVGLIVTPSLLMAILDACLKPKEVLVGQHIIGVIRSTLRSLTQASLRIVCLPHEAMYSTEAILRSTGRILLSRKNLLQWIPHAELNHAPKTGIIASYLCMLSAPLVAVLTIAELLLLNHFEIREFDNFTFFGVAPFLILWLISPFITWWMSQPINEKETKLSEDQKTFLFKIARKTWAYFDQYVTADDHWLPPDNVQEMPGPIIARRTSPTNIGLALLANLAAYDFAFISTGNLLQRTTNSLRSMRSLERHQGHFYNWYSTETLQPLPPRYISTVDSGNLTGNLLTLRAGLILLPEQKIVDVRLFSALQYTLAIVEDQLDSSSIDSNSVRQNSSAIAPDALVNLKKSFAKLRRQIESAVAAPSIHLQAALQFLERISLLAEDLKDDMVTAFSLKPILMEILWMDYLLQQTQDAIDEIQFLVPWLKSVDKLLEPDHDQNHKQNQRMATFAFGEIPTLRQLANSDLFSDHDTLNIQLSGQRALERIAHIGNLIVQTTDLATVEYAFLYDPARKLMAIGYNVDEYRRDASYYDLLASEARLSNFVAIAQGKLPQESWFALGRLRTVAGGEPVLVSWSGSMFEYLMPNLIMPTYKGTLLEQTCRAVVARQIEFGKQRNLPWGVSESGYNLLDAALNYQYHAFGVPGLGFRRGLGEDWVISPYSSALALMIAPEAACENLQNLSSMDMEGPFGFYEAIDFTPSRLIRGQASVTVRSFMAHHQGMSLLSLAYALLNRPMQKRFESDPQIQATLLLLQERIPKSSVLQTDIAEHAEGAVIFAADEVRAYAPIAAETPIAEVQLLSNGIYHVMVTNAGAGYSRWKDLAVTRWREDGTCDNWGNFIYLRDQNSREFWSNTHQPTLKPADLYEALFSEWRAEYRRRDYGIETYTELVVSPEDNIELRRIKLTNRTQKRRTIELTSYAEVVLTTQAADVMQTAFAKLFVQTEIIEDRHAILCTRRPRSATESIPWMFHLLATHGVEVSDISYETDRMKFIGRGHTTAAPAALIHTQNLSGSQGSVLDPIVAIRCSVTLEAEQSILLDFVCGVAESREQSMSMVEKYQDRHLTDRVFDLAYTHSNVALRQINTREADTALYRRFARSIIYANSLLRADANLLIQNRRGQSGLWGYSISGDLPIVLLKIANSDNIDLARQLIQCHTYWRIKGLAVDLVIWNEDYVGYRQRLQDQIMGLIATGSEAKMNDRPGGIFVRSAEQISVEDRILLQSVARVIIVDSRGSLQEQLGRWRIPTRKMPLLLPQRMFSKKSMFNIPPAQNKSDQDALANVHQNLLLSNGLGGFSRDGREYVIHSNGFQTTPLPWVNVLANPDFGSVVTESGTAYTWSENAHEFRLTPWSDDPVGATSGEMIYLRDDETGEFWSPTPLPLEPTPLSLQTAEHGDAQSSQANSFYTTRHGFGYSVFEHNHSGIISELCVYVDLTESVKYSVLKVRNNSGKTRRLSATGYVEWVLGDLRSKSAMHIVTEIDAGSGALFARNSYNTEFVGRVAFFDVDDPARTLTGDRVEFLGRNRSITNPDALTRTQLSGKLGAALDPCGAIHVPFELADGQTREIIFRLGAGKDIEQARALAQKLRITGTARAALQTVQEYWQRTLGSVQIKTPDIKLNLLANGWLLYQTLACRFWARSGFYQSGGAFGFRDQLQDSMALIHAEPRLVREHLLRSGRRQYAEGDVQHWWHPPLGRGVRTRCSDDYLWLPLVTCYYVKCTGDFDVLNENIHFLGGRQLGKDEESYYDLPAHSEESANLYQHCVRAIKNGLRFGEHGLPLMGSGDWNDGMNLVGIEGKGESVWLGFFLFDVLMSFANLAAIKEDPLFQQHCLNEAETLKRNLDINAWDGKWYKRAYFDDGTPLGSEQNTECSIDSISQSWSVLSEAGTPPKMQMAMSSLNQYLVRRDQGIIQLLDPPFDKTLLNPGYIKGYVPGVRENGGQYTHAAVWAAMAFAKLGDSKNAWDLFAIINPLNHTRTTEEINIYKAEPYVVAADVYAIDPHSGRGGWTWYTGSAGLCYRLIIESLLGLQRDGNDLIISPCLPTDWPSCHIDYRFMETEYHIDIFQSIDESNPDATVINTVVDTVTVDGVACKDKRVQMVNDRRDHGVVVTIKAQ